MGFQSEIQDTTGIGQLCVPNVTTSRMVYRYIVATHSVTIDATKGDLIK